MRPAEELLTIPLKIIQLESKELRKPRIYCEANQYLKLKDSLLMRSH